MIKEISLIQDLIKGGITNSVENSTQLGVPLIFTEGLNLS
jgi:hypothetical protein